MKNTNEHNPQPDLIAFIGKTLFGAIASSKGRLVIFCVVIFFQFFAVSLYTDVLKGSYPDTYTGLLQLQKDDKNANAVSILTKYLLLLLLIIGSPRVPGFKRSLLKFAVLFGALFFWFIADVLRLGFSEDNLQDRIYKKSFEENSVPIFGKVVFTSFTRNERYQKRGVPVAETLSDRTTGYLLIVQVDSSYYPSSQLKTHFRNFNSFRYDGPVWKNIPSKDPDLSSCLQFTVGFFPEMKRAPDLPALNNYVKIRYDPKENGIELVVDSATGATPVFDSAGVKKNQ
jgi:hypothetical protein